LAIFQWKVLLVEKTVYSRAWWISAQCWPLLASWNWIQWTSQLGFTKFETVHSYYLTCTFPMKNFTRRENVIVELVNLGPEYQTSKYWYYDVHCTVNIRNLDGSGFRMVFFLSGCWMVWLTGQICPVLILA
jgi:hypothetical protein